MFFKKWKKLVCLELSSAFLFNFKTIQSQPTKIPTVTLSKSMECWASSKMPMHSANSFSFTLNRVCLTNRH